MEGGGGIGQRGGLLQDIVEVISFNDGVVGFHGWSLPGCRGRATGKEQCTENSRAVLGATIRAADGLGRD